jgi:hypothetical protein
MRRRWRWSSHLGETALKVAAGFMAVGIYAGFAQDGGETERGLASVSGPVALRAAAVTVPLQARPAAGPNGTLMDNLSRLGDKERLFLVIGELETDQQPGVAYDVFLNRPSNTPANEAGRYLVGSLNFFNVRSGTKTGRPSFFSFDVTEAARAMLKRGNRERPATVTIVPDGSPSAGAHPIVGRIELVLLRNESR